jgi:hypothetical protein
MKACGELEVYLHVFTSSALDGAKWSTSCPATVLQSRWYSGCPSYMPRSFGEEEMPQPDVDLWLLSHPIRSLVTIQTDLPRRALMGEKLQNVFQGKSKTVLRKKINLSYGLLLFSVEART